MTGRDEPTLPRRPALLAVLAGNMLLDSLDVSIVLVGLPSMAANLHLPLFDAQWLVSGFAAGFAAALLLGPAVTRRWGRRLPYLVALLVFAAASIAGGLVGNVGVIIATRVIKGACAAFTAPTGLAIIGSAFPAGRERMRALSIYALVGASGFTVGVLAAGGLTMASWRWDLLAPAPVGLVLAVIALRALPADVRPDGGTPRPAARKLVANAAWWRSAVGAAALNGIFLGLLLLTMWCLCGRTGWSAWRVAAALLPACLPVVCVSPLASKLVERFGTTKLIVSGATAAAAGCALRSLSKGSYAGAMLPALALLGIGFALSFAALNTQVVAATTSADRPRAVALYQVCVQCGAIAMLTVVTAVAAVAGTDRPALVLITAVGLLAMAVAGTGVLADLRRTT